MTLNVRTGKYSKRNSKRWQGERAELNEKAEKLQNICKCTCQKYIKKKEIIEGDENEWWNNKYERFKRIVNKTRRAWQWTRLVQWVRKTTSKQRK